MQVLRNVLYGLVATLLLFSVSIAIQQTLFSLAREVGGDLPPSISGVASGPVARVAASTSGEDDASIEATGADSDRPAVKRGPATWRDAEVAPDRTEAASDETLARDQAASDPPARVGSNAPSALASRLSSVSGGAAGTHATVARPSASPAPASLAANGAQVTGMFFGDSAETACHPGGREFGLDDLRGLYVCIVWPGPMGTSAPQLVFLSPDGNVYQTMTLPVVTAEAPTTVATLPVAGTYISRHTLAGRWMVKVSLNGQPVNQDSFTLRQ